MSGFPHILRHTGMCGSNVSDFHKNSLNMGKFSTQVPLNMSLPTFPELLGVNIANTQKL